ncbi:hypothetical protein [Clostridium sp. HMP27]|uniref:hypothetical protein n=1 Tax=Clostridium sp. HMP27 TaxID=1487921 RepID=UPI00052E3CD0|nr:hypothetical protein [Clostridium sp. HMP27]KGK88048.1 hypothetical protein DP68_08970 [Clostridium sp. HMP27]
MTADGIGLIYETIKSNLLKCQVLINGNYKDAEIQKVEKTNDSIKVFVYLDEDFVGTIIKYRLVTIAGKIFDERNDNIQKDNKRGLLTLFEYKIKEE